MKKVALKLINNEDFNAEVDGKRVALYTLTAGDLTMQVTNYGARVVSLWAPDRDGAYEDVVLGYEHIDRYVHNCGERFLGAVVGRYANRIAGGRFDLDGMVYSLPQNNNGQTLHGGVKGVDRVVWEVKSATAHKLVLCYVAKDGEEGFPGNLSIEMTYELTPQNEFKVTYLATTDAPTVVNLSHHSFFNLMGEGRGTITDHILTIHGDYIIPVNSVLIPTGEMASVEGTPFDFREPHVIGERIEVENEQLKMGAGYDHCWVLSRPAEWGTGERPTEEGTGDCPTEGGAGERPTDGGAGDCPTDEVALAATLWEPGSGRYMEVFTDQPGIQFYCGNFFDYGSSNGKYGRPLKYRESLALETQKFPDSPNHPHFPSTLLRPGELYSHTCIYKFGAK